MTNKNNSSRNLVVFGVGLVTGWLVKQLFDSPQVKEKREEMMDSAEELRQRLADSDEVSRITEVFGSYSRELAKFYQQAKEQLITQLGDLRISFDQIDKERYQAIVTEIVKSAGKDGQLPASQLEKLKQALIEDFSKLQLTTKPTASRANTRGATATKSATRSTRSSKDNTK